MVVAPAALARGAQLGLVVAGEEHALRRHCAQDAELLADDLLPVERARRGVEGADEQGEAALQVVDAHRPRCRRVDPLRRQALELVQAAHGAGAQVGDVGIVGERRQIGRLDLDQQRIRRRFLGRLRCPAQVAHQGAATRAERAGDEQAENGGGVARHARR